MMYLKTILMRNEEELTLRVYEEQEKNPSPGDLSELVKADFKNIGLDYNKDDVIMSSKEQYKAVVKNLTRDAAFKELKDIQTHHTKVKDIAYNKLDCQPYLSNAMFSNEEASILAAARSHTIRGIRCNFKNLYKENLHCPLNCFPQQLDTQEHLFNCHKLQGNSTLITNRKVDHDDIYGDVLTQKAVTVMLKDFIEKRNKLIEKDTNLPVGQSLDPST